MIRAIFLDAAGTMIHLPKGVGWHYREVAARHGLELGERELGAAFSQAFRSAGPRAVGRREDDDKGWWRDLVRTVLTTCGHAPGEMAFGGMFEELYARFAEPGVWALYPEVEGVLAGLRGRYRMGVLSNFDRRLYPVLSDLGVARFFDTVTLSSEAGADKPDPLIFEAALAVMGVRPAEAVLAGDDPVQDWRGAEAAGMHVYRVERPEAGLEGLPAFVSQIS